MEIYCDIIETLSEKCFEYSVLELWHYDEKVIRFVFSLSVTLGYGPVLNVCP